MSSQQLVCYMKHIHLSPSRVDVVNETRKRSKIVSDKFGQKYALVTYDLAIVKIVKRIQCEEKPQFDNVFIMFGSSHIEMAFFLALGKITEGSEGPYIRSERSAVATGSMKKFLRRKF